MSSIARILGALLTLGSCSGTVAGGARAVGAVLRPGWRARVSASGLRRTASSARRRQWAMPSSASTPTTTSGDVLQQTTTGLAFWRKSTEHAHLHGRLPSLGAHSCVASWPGTASQSIHRPRHAAPSGPSSQGAGQPGIAQSGRTEGRRRAHRRPGAAPPPRRSCTAPWTRRQRRRATGPARRRNPSCGREDWWAQWNDIQDSRLAPVPVHRARPGD